MDLCIYHGNCNDGFAAALVVWEVYRDQCEYLPANYGDTPPDVRGKDVIIVDFSYKRGVMERFIDEVSGLVCLDHHKTAQAELKGLPGCHFDMEKSGAMMAWDYFHPKKDVPMLINYVQDRDLWHWELKNSKRYSAFLSALPKEFETWAKYLDDDEFKVTAAYGKWILKAQEQYVDRMVADNVSWTHVLGYFVPIVNTTYQHSELIGELAKDQPFAVGYFDIENRRVFSLRSREGGIDVSEVAKEFGGGGHQNAAGFEIERPGYGI